MTLFKESLGFKCELCDYNAIPATALKYHMTKKHMKEKLRMSSASDSSLKLSPPPSFLEESLNPNTTLSPSSPCPLPCPLPHHLHVNQHQLVPGMQVLVSFYLIAMKVTPGEESVIFHIQQYFKDFYFSDCKWT